MAKPELKIKPSIFNPVYLPYLDEVTRTQIFYGGAGSGKSVFISQRAVYDVCKGGRNYLCTRKVASTIKRSCFNEIVKVIKAWNVEPWFSINNSDQIITNKINGNQILFAGLDDVEKIKSITPVNGVITDIWCEEATENEAADIKQLEYRLRGKAKYPKRIILSFNPILKTHWIYSTYFGKWVDGGFELKDNNVCILKTTYKDNKFLTADDVQKMESETDRYWRDVYVNGNWGILGSAIFRNWKVEDLSSMIPAFDNFRNGVDFGFAADPAALIRSHYDKKYNRIYIVKAWKDLGITNDVLAEKIKEVCGKEIVMCDSAEPKSIAEICNHGARAVAAKKGRDSIVFGIQWLQQQEIIVDVSCQDVVNELQQYKWKEDAAGNVLPIPVDKWNHYLDALRYSYSLDMGMPWVERTEAEESFKDKLLKRYGLFKKKAGGYGRH